ncbi:MAG: ATP-binding protein, partial [bacterium]
GLIQGACDCLVEWHGCNCARLALTGEGGTVESYAAAGFCETPEPDADYRMPGWLTPCEKETLAGSAVNAYRSTDAVCAGCPFAGVLPGHSSLLVPLGHESGTYGFLHAVMFGDRAFDAEEQSLFEEIGGDISFALHAVSAEEKHRKAEAALRESEERFRRLAENAPDIIIRAVPGCGVEYVNPAIEKITGYSPGEITGRWGFLASRIHPGDRACIIENLQEPGCRDAERKPVQFRFIAKEGREVWMEALFIPVVNEADKVIAVECIARDVTERKRAEKEREEMQRLLMQSEKLSALGELISGVAHELNNPLSAVLGFSQLLLLEKDKPKEELAADLRKIVDNAERCRRIVRNLLIFARRHRPEKTVVDVIGIIEDVVALREYQLRVEDIAVLRTYPEKRAGINLFADRHQLHQVLLNLINNAEYSVKETGKPGAIIISVERENGEVLIVVEDTGAGIRKEDITRVFDPFYTTKAPGVGTGLGLSVSYGIIREHGGTIWAESEYGHGAAFYIRLPVSYKKTAGRKAPPAKTPAKGKRSGGRILVIDDERSVLSVMERVLKRAGYDVECADNGEKAIALLKEKSYDLVVSDMRMPEVSGEEIYVFLKENRPDMLGRIIFTTGDTVSETTREFFAESGVKFLEKPFGVELLLTAVEEGFARCKGKS